MTSKEWVDKFERDFTRMKHNREKVPLDVLQTRYERAYNTLVAELECDADWFVNPQPLSPGWDWDKITAIRKRESRPGGLVWQYKKALVDALDLGAFMDAGMQYFDLLRREAWKGHTT